MNRFAKTDKKWTFILQGAGHMIYIACYETDQDLLKKAENSGLLSFVGTEDYLTKKALIWYILDVIAKDSSRQSIKREFDLLTSIQ